MNIPRIKNKFLNTLVDDLKRFKAENARFIDSPCHLVLVKIILINDKKIIASLKDVEYNPVNNSFIVESDEYESHNIRNITKPRVIEIDKLDNCCF